MHTHNTQKAKADSVFVVRLITLGKMKILSMSSGLFHLDPRGIK